MIVIPIFKTVLVDTKIFPHHEYTKIIVFLMLFDKVADTFLSDTIDVHNVLHRVVATLHDRLGYSCHSIHLLCYYWLMRLCNTV